MDRCLEQRGALTFYRGGWAPTGHSARWW